MALVRQSVTNLQAYTPGEQPKEPGIIKLNTNENPYPPSPKIEASLRRWSLASLQRYPDPVCTKLREQIAGIHGCAPDQVFVGNGSDEILALAARAFAERGGTIGYFEPSYSLYPVLAAIEDIPAKPIPLAENFGWAMPDKYQASLFFLTNPNAPTSMLFPKKQVADLCNASKGVVLIDEAYVDFAPYDCMDLAMSMPNVLVARTLSKSYSLAGVRLGYAVGAKPLIAALHKIKDSYNVSALAQLIGAAALADPHHMRQNVEKIRTTRERVASSLRQRGWHVCVSATNFLWARPAGVTAEHMFHALRTRKIIVRHFPGPATGEYLRITIGTDNDMNALLGALDAAPAPDPAR
jgi:histidinol-phosphate aminotransferase